MRASCSDFLSPGPNEIAIVAKVHLGEPTLAFPARAPAAYRCPYVPLVGSSGSHGVIELSLGAPVSPTVGTGAPYISAGSIDLYSPADGAAEEEPVAGRAFLPDRSCPEASIAEPVCGCLRRRWRPPKLGSRLGTRSGRSQRHPYKPSLQPRSSMAADIGQSRRSQRSEVGRRPPCSGDRSLS